MNLFLQTLSSRFAERLVVLQTDRTGWRQSAQVQLPDDVRLLCQPAHRPELNPVEHLWDDWREKALANRAFKLLEKVQAAQHISFLHPPGVARGLSRLQQRRGNSGA
jgi:hypothetical protein